MEEEWQVTTELKLELGPADHGRPITNEELAAADFVVGYQYEVIDGRLFVSYEPDAPEHWVERWLLLKLYIYSLQRPDVINYVCNKPRVFVHARRRETIPEPDIAAYQGFPVELPIRELRWEDVSPLVVVEILCGDPTKDFVRNVRLYLQVPTIREYWVIDTGDDPDRPTLYVYRRRGDRWQQRIEINYGETYTTRLLPGFELLLDPRR
jgi:Uma2 family endonuclease